MAIVSKHMKDTTDYISQIGKLKKNKISSYMYEQTNSQKTMEV